MRFQGNKLALSVPELDKTYGVPEGTINQGMSRHRNAGSPSWKHFEDEFDKRVKWVYYDHIPSSTIRKYGIPSKGELVAKYKEEQTQLHAATLAVAGSALVGLHSRTVVATDYNFFFTRAGLTATPDATVEVKAMQLTQAAGWLRLLAGIEGKHQLRGLGFGRKEELREAVLNEVAPLNLYGLRVGNVRVLQAKELAFTKALQLGADGEVGLSVQELKQQAAQRALLTLVPNRYGKQNARKIGKQQGENGALIPIGARIDGSEWHANTVMNLFMNPGKGAKFDLKEVHRRYLRACAAADKEPVVKLSGMKGFLKDDAVRAHTAWERDGHSALEQFISHQKRERPTYSLSKGGYDGFQMDFYTQVGAAKAMLTVVAVFDYHSEAITGYSVGLVENGLLVRNMYRNHLKQLGGRSFIEIESDRFSGNLAKDTVTMFERACQYVTRPVPNDPRKKGTNPKARLAERLLAEVNRLAQSMPDWKGTNVTSIDDQRKPNPDYANAPMTNSTLEIGIKRVNELIAAYNHSEVEKWNGQTRWQRLEADLHPEAPVLDALDQATLLSQHTVTTVRHAAISITVGKKGYDYEFPQYVRHTQHMGKGLKVRVYFDETDLSSVNVFGFSDAKDPATDVYLTTLKRTQRVQMAKAEQTPTDLVLLAEKEAQRNAMRAEFDRKQLEVQAANYGLAVPAGIGLKELRALVKGAELTSTLVEDFSTRHAQALGSPAAVAQLDYYADTLLRDEGMRVPVEAKPTAKKPGLSYRDRMNAYRDSGHDFS
jgi:hypothetical protein